ncbi:hypothetical protein [Oerskovia enterophila]|uniref:Uncharacterized protein n=1 Tax=Oerskovia enterophila TaxID=43678 RepID=A0ABX2YCV2_9CELL|nr:hypothetical protein [Oerskovia enterophila]OCI32801.1 hypothetical protein OERS_03930 [Oerskovia enterophila]
MTRKTHAFATTTLTVLTFLTVTACTSPKEGEGVGGGEVEKTTTRPDDEVAESRARFDEMVVDAEATFASWDEADAILSTKATEVQSFCDANWQDTGDIASGFTDAQACFDWRIRPYFPFGSVVYRYDEFAVAQEEVAEQRERFVELSEAATLPADADGISERTSKIAVIQGAVFLQVEATGPAVDMVLNPPKTWDDLG